jgi:acyl-CoA thioester hydrolase
MGYELSYTVKPEHIDFQDIMDGLYYPYYMEDCRHRFVKDILHLDIREEAQRGVNAVLSQYTIRFFRPLRRDDAFVVTCQVSPDESGKPQIHFHQEMLRDGKLIASATFTATFVATSGGRPFLPETLVEQLKQAQTHE